jgi:hypothetical protein
MTSRFKLALAGGALLALALLARLFFPGEPGTPAEEPRKVFALLSTVRYYPSNYSTTTLRDITEINYFLGPRTELQTYLYVCGDQRSRFVAGNYFRGMYQVYDVPVRIDSHNTTFKRCAQFSELEEWASSARHAEGLTGVLKSLSPTQDDRRHQLTLRLPDGGARTVAVCNDGNILGGLVGWTEKSVELTLDTGLHSQNIGCDPIFDARLSTAVGALYASDLRSVLLLQAFATPLPDRTTVPTDLANQLRRDNSDYASARDAMTLPISSNGALALVVDGECGSGGCGLGVWARRELGYELVLESFGQEVRALNEETAGLRSLAVLGRTHAYIYQFNGTRYVESECFMADSDTHRLTATACGTQPAADAARSPMMVSGGDPSDPLQLRYRSGRSLGPVMLFDDTLTTNRDVTLVVTGQFSPAGVSFAADGWTKLATPQPADLTVGFGVLCPGTALTCRSEAIQMSIVIKKRELTAPVLMSSVLFRDQQGQQMFSTSATDLNMTAAPKDAATRQAWSISIPVAVARTLAASEQVTVEAGAVRFSLEREHLNALVRLIQLVDRS